MRDRIFNSLGAVLYTMATGHPPVRGDSALAVLRRVTEEKPRPVHEWNEAMPAWVDRLIAKFLDKSLERRVPTAEEATELLRSCLAHVRAPSRMELPVEIAGQSRRRSWVIAVALSSVLLFIGYAFVMNSGSPSSQQTTNTVPPVSFQQPSSVGPSKTIDFEDEAWRARLQSLSNELNKLKQELNEN